MILNPSGDIAAMRTAILRREQAFSVEGRDLVLYVGGLQSAHVLRSSASLGGVRIAARMSYPEGKGAEHVTYRTYVVEFSALVPTGSGAGGGVLSFEETLTFEGGGTVYGHIETLTGKPVKQTLRKQSLYKAVQEGRIVGANGYPNIPPPIFPNALVKSPMIAKSSARPVEGHRLEYPFSYRYEFESVTTLDGVPNQRPE